MMTFNRAGVNGGSSNDSMDTTDDNDDNDGGDDDVMLLERSCDACNNITQDQSNNSGISHRESSGETEAMADTSAIATTTTQKSRNASASSSSVVLISAIAKTSNSRGGIVVVNNKDQQPQQLQQITNRTANIMMLPQEDDPFGKEQQQQQCHEESRDDHHHYHHNNNDPIATLPSMFRYHHDECINEYQIIAEHLPLHEMIPHWPPHEDSLPIEIPWIIFQHRCLLHPQELTISYFDYYHMDGTINFMDDDDDDDHDGYNHRHHDDDLSTKHIIHAMLQRNPPLSVFKIAMYALMESSKSNGTQQLQHYHFTTFIQIAKDYHASKDILQFLRHMQSQQK